MTGLNERLKDLNLDINLTPEQEKKIMYDIKESFNTDSHDRSYAFNFAFNGSGSILTTLLYILFGIGAFKMLVSSDVVGGLIKFLNYLR